MRTAMKLSAIGLFVALGALTACDDDHLKDVVLTDGEIPTEIKAYVQTHFPSHTIVRAEKDVENKKVTYDIDLSQQVSLEFNSTFNITDIDGNAQLPDSVIPSAILEYVSTNYANNYITDWELEFNHQQVELNNNLELEFEMDGTFKRIDND